MSTSIRTRFSLWLANPVILFALIFLLNALLTRLSLALFSGAQ